MLAIFLYIVKIYFKIIFQKKEHPLERHASMRINVRDNKCERQWFYFFILPLIFYFLNLGIKALHNYSSYYTRYNRNRMEVF